MNRPKHLYLNSRDDFFRVDITKIVYFESDGNYTTIVTNSKNKTTICINLMRMQEILSANLRESAGMFARVGKRHIVNLNFVYHIAITRQKLVMSDGDKFEYVLDVSKEALKKLRDMYISGLSRTMLDKSNPNNTKV